MMNDNENMVSDAVAQDMELTDPQGSEPQSADAKNAQEASSNDDFHRTGRMQLYVRRFMRRQIGMIFQDHHLLMDRTVYDNVAIPLIIAGASGDDIRRRVSAALDKVGLLDKAKNFPIQLSGGEQQRVGIARAVVNKPAVLLADEPTGNLDDALSEGILRLFEEFNRVGVTVLMATHDINLISRRSYRMLTLSDGHLHGGVGHE